MELEELLFFTGDKIQMNVQLLVLSALCVEAALVYMFFDAYASRTNRIIEMNSANNES